MKTLNIFLITLFTLAAANAQPKRIIKPVKNLQTIIQGHISSKNFTDSIMIRVWPDLVSYRKKDFIPRIFKLQKLKNGNFKFAIDSLSDVAYFSISQTEGAYVAGDPFLNEFLISPGDSINISENPRPGAEIKLESGKIWCLNCSKVQFTGKGSASLRLQWDLKEAYRKNQDSLQVYQSKLTVPTYEPIEAIIRRRFNTDIPILSSGYSKILNSYKKQIEPELFELIKTNIYAERYFEFISNIAASVGLREPKQPEIDSAIIAYEEVLPKINFLKGSSQKALLHTTWYSYALVVRSALEQRFYKKDAYSLLKQYETGPMRERIVTNFLIDYNRKSNIDSLANDALTFVNKPFYRSILQSIVLEQKIGTQAYNFELPDKDGRLVKLSDFKGKLVFIDFYFTGCGGCSEYFKRTLSKVEDHYKGNDKIKFLTVCIDVEKAKWIKGLKQGIYTSEMATNLYTAGMGSQHPITQQLKVISYPNPIVIDKEGKILNNSYDQLNVGPNDLISLLDKYL
ncbi:TlpA disulfide reductase family protein [Mucilaginibacter defluvii]|uniref:Thioredoxin domain-containing protein n=1 Tax=Mucilaginibacter defluvii TaxID=1196019 RepID=A0ABP9FK37_9SPHI